MIFKKAHERVAMHASFGSDYNRYVCQVVLDEVIQNVEQDTVHALIKDDDLGAKWKTKLSAKFERAFKS